MSSPRSAAAALLCACLLPATAAAQQIGTALSGPTTADGASAWINPASMGAGDGTHVELVGGVALVALEYQPDGGRGSAAESSAVAPIVTAGAFTDALHDDVRIGLTAAVANLAGCGWGRDGGALDITRYYMVDGALYHLSVAPALSWSPAEWITLGAGADIVYGRMRMDLDKDLGVALNEAAGSTELESPFPYAHPDLAAPVEGSADGMGVGAIVGALVRPAESVSVGLAVHTPVTIDGTGTLSVDYPERVRQFVADTVPSAELPDLDGSFDVELDRPLIMVGGVSVRPVPELELAAHYQFEHLSSQPTFDIVITEASSESIGNTTKPQAYMNRHRVAVRLVHQPIAPLRLAVFGSFQSNTIPEQTTAPNNIDFDRFEVGLAAHWQALDDLGVLVQYSHIHLADRVVDESLHRPLTQPSLAAFNHPSPTGTYGGSAHTIRLGLALRL